MIDLEPYPKTHFVQFYLKVASCLLFWGKNKNKAVMNIHKKLKN